MLLLIGVNHRSAPVALRERVAVSEERIPQILDRLMVVDGIEEALVLSTCNRVEFIARASSGAQPGLAALREFLIEHQGFTAEELSRHSYCFEGRQVVRHLYRVAAGLDSMIVGEPQILGQVKQAYRIAKGQGATGRVLERLLQHGLAAAKRVRTETGISRTAVSVAFAAVELARKIFGELPNRRVLVIGAGKMSDLVAKHLHANGVHDLTVCSRTYNHAETMAARRGGRAVHWDDGLAGVAAADIVVSCTGAPRPILTRDAMMRAVRARHGAPLFVIDIAVPRDVEPCVNELDNVYLYDIDELQGVVDSNLEERRRSAEEALSLIEVEVDAFDLWRRQHEVAPLIVSLRESLLGVAQSEIERFRSRLGSLAPPESRTVEELTRAVVQKILHRPIHHLRGAVERGDVDECAALYREIFGVEDAKAATSPPQQEERRDDDRPGPRRLLRGGKND